MKTWKTILMPMAVLCTAGFTYAHYPLQVLNAGSASPSFVFQKPDPAAAAADPVPLKYLAVHARSHGSHDFDEVVWEIGTGEAGSVPVKTVVYGQVPAGFVETAPPQTLVVGRDYYVMGIGDGASGGAGFTR